MVSVSIVAAMVLVLLASGVVQAAVFQCPVGDVDCLIAAINTANGTGEDDTIQLEAGTYTITAVDNEIDPFGANGLPSITSVLAIQGTGAESTILERAADAPSFRLLHVSPDGVLQLEGLTVRGGAGFSGGGILSFGDVRLTNSRLTDNGAFDGGGLFNFGGVVTIANTVFADNLAGEAGGGLASLDGTVQITESSFLSNGAVHPGGGIFNCGGTVTITTTTFANNGADPGAIANVCFGDTPEGTMTLVNTTIADNAVGGISNGGTMLVLDSAIVRNESLGSSGAPAGIDNGGTLTLINTTVADNQSGPFSPTGVIDNGGTLTLINTTVADNQSVFGTGGLRNRSGGTAVLVNTILARNTAFATELGGVPDCSGAVTSQGHNLIGDLTGCTIMLQPSDLTGDPGLGSLVDDGTPGRAHLPLLAGSRAIDAGDDEVCTADPRLATDQLGHPRVGICDIGAIEFQSQALTVALDIKPGTFPNTINLKSNGVIPVAILTTDTFDATTVDPLSVHFGPNEATEAHGQGHIEDVNQDGEADLVLHFRTQDTGIQCGESSASLTGQTVGGEPIQGSDAIQIVGCHNDR